MRTSIPIPVKEVVPSVRAVLEAQGIPRWKQTNERTLQLAATALSLFEDKAKPVGIFMRISRQDFEPIFSGEGRNEHQTPVRPIADASRSLTLFAVTVGQEVSAEISRLFSMNDFALGAMLDSVASEGTELAAQHLQNLCQKQLRDEGLLNSRSGLLRFSPGYCGWHVSGQRKLFDTLLPLEVGISLNDSFLMQPLKSISGVIISGDRDIFDFDDTFYFCGECADHSCRERIEAIMNE